MAQFGDDDIVRRFMTWCVKSMRTTHGRISYTRVVLTLVLSLYLAWMALQVACHGLDLNIGY